MEGVAPTRSILCQATPLFALFSVTRTKLAVDMWKKSVIIVLIIIIIMLVV